MVEQYELHRETSTDQLIERLEQPGPTVVAFEGGPCGGKTTIAGLLAAEAINQDRQVVILPEVATELGTKLLEQGLSIPYLAEHNRPGYLAFQKDLITKIAQNIQRAKEEYAGTNALIIADRSDNGAYMTPEEYQEVLADTGFTAPPHATLIDTIIYLPSLAHSDAERYESLMQTNQTRFESASDAIATCLRNMHTISTHPNMHVYWDTDFDSKIKRVIHDILQTPEQSDQRILASGTSSELLHAVLHKVDAVSLEPSAVTCSTHPGFNLEHRSTSTGHNLYYYVSLKPNEPCTALSEYEFTLLRGMHCYDEQSYLCQQHIVSAGDSKTIATTKQYNDGRWTLEVQ